MTTTAIAFAALAAAAFPLLLWAIGRAVTAAGSRVPPSGARPRQYLAATLTGVRITAVVTGDGELLATLAAPGYGRLAATYRISASECSLARVIRWRDENTRLRACLSQDGAIMLADPALGGNAACELPTATAAPARAPAASPDHAPTEDR
jgi:hypothetical protein